MEPTPKSNYFNNSIFWIELEKIVPNPYQPRREFDQHALKDLADSIRMYGLLQPLVVTRKEKITEEGGLVVQYELISGERRLRASKLAGLSQAPVIIRAAEEDARVKLELAIIENLQREDLNAVDRARSFQRLADEFGLKHVQIAEKMGKSREYVTNSIRLLALPEHMLQALSEKRITEGHSRPLLMLADKPEEQETLFKEIIYKKITVREAEQIARRVAIERVRKKDASVADPEIREFEQKLNQALGTRVMIEKREKGGKVVIDFFTNEDLRHLLDVLENREKGGANDIAKIFAASMTEAYTPVPASASAASAMAASASVASAVAAAGAAAMPAAPIPEAQTVAIPDSSYGHEEVVPLAVPADQATPVEYADVPTIEEAFRAVEAEMSGIAPAVSAPESLSAEEAHVEPAPVDDSTPADQAEDEDLYSIKNFSL